MQLIPSFSKTRLSIAVSSALLSAWAPLAFAEDNSNETDTIEVIGRSGDGLHDIDNTATKMSLSLKDTGRSIALVSKEEISDMAATDTRDVAAYQAGFNWEYSAPRFVYHRGIQTNINTFMTNGLRNLQAFYVGTGSLLPNTYNLESVTFLSGADSMLYGSGIAGGVINSITKKPQEDAQTTFGLRTRSYAASDVGYFDRNQLVMDFDSTGPLGEYDDVLYRLIAQVSPDGEDYQDHHGNDDVLIDTSLTFKIGDHTRITPRFEYKDQERQGGSGWTDGYFGSNFINGSLGSTTGSVGSFADRSYDYGSPLDVSTTTMKTAELSVEHQLNPNWSINGIASYVRTEAEGQTLYVSNSSALGNSIGDTTLERKWAYSKSDDTYYLADINTEGQFTLANLDHHVLFGVNLRRAEIRTARSFQDNADALGNYTISVSDPSDQMYSAMPSSLKDVDLTPTTDRDLNIYLKDRVTIGDFTLALGLGYLDFNGKEQSNSGDFEQNFYHFSYDAGVIYRLNNDVNLFATYSQSYDPVDTSDIVQYGQDGVDYDPEQSDNYEIGFKGSFFDQRLTSTVTLFYINKTNLTYTETADNDETVLYQNSGESFRAHGVEVNARYHFNPEFYTQISYAYTDAHDTMLGDDPGKQADMTPYNSLTVWNSYDPADTPWRYALGMRSQSSRSQTSTSLNGYDFELPGYAEFDFGTYYETKNWDASLLIKNLFDLNRADAVSNWTTVSSSDPRSINLGFKYRL